MTDKTPAGHSFRFDGCWNGVQVSGTAVARHDRIEFFPVPGVCLEVPLDQFSELVSKLMVAAHTRPSS